MGLLRDRMAEDLKLCGYSRDTVRLYLHYAKHFAKHFGRSPAEMGEAQVRTYLLHLLDERKLSHATYRQCYASLKFLYSVTLGRAFEVESIPRHRDKPSLPVVLSGTEVERLLAAMRNPKHRTIAMVAYAAGLRIREACSLRVSDIDSKRMLLLVRRAKGGSQRYVMLSARLLRALREYWIGEKPSDVLFPGDRPENPITPEVVRRVMHVAARDAGLTKNVTPHVLRHSFATHLLESGVDIRVVQVLLGHRHIEMTARYTQVSTEHIQRVKSPFDLLGTAAGAAFH